MTAFIQYEFNEGVQAYLPPYPTAGFENSLFFRKLQFSEVMAKQIPDEQLKTLPNMPIRRSSYGPGECQKVTLHYLRSASRVIVLTKNAVCACACICPLLTGDAVPPGLERSIGIQVPFASGLGCHGQAEGREPPAGEGGLQVGAQDVCRVLRGALLAVYISYFHIMTSSAL